MNVTSTVDSSWATAGSVYGLTFAADATNGSYVINQGAGVTSLTIGAGGITNNRTVAAGAVTLSGSLVVGADQTWTQTTTSWNGGRLSIQANLSGSSNVTVAGPNGGAVFFESGNSTSFTGAFTLDGSGIRLGANDQLGRLGSKTLTWKNTNGSALSFFNLSGADQALSFATPINFVNDGSTGYTVNIDGSVTGNSSLAITGAWTGLLNAGIRFNNGENNKLVTKFQQDGSALTSTKGNSNQGNSAIYFSTGEYSINNANAFGSGNSLSISLGNGGTTSAGAAKTSLYADNGLSVASALIANRNYNNTTDNARSDVVTIGVKDNSTSATFSGTLKLEGTNYTATVSDFDKNREANVHLQVTSGSTVTFSGNIIENTANANANRYVPVIVQGGGTVNLSGTNSSYRGGTSVINGTTLLANGGSGASGSATGEGSLLVGYDAASVTGTTTLNQSFITGVTTIGLHVGQTITGAGIVDGTVITYIHPTIAGRIEISNNATVSGTVSLSGAAETGILGGSGTIKPGVINGASQSIIVASGSMVSPGMMGSIGILTIDGGGSTAAIATFAAGAKFGLDLNATGMTSDRVALVNGSAGDFVFNGNVINLSLMGILLEGQQYTLFDGTSNDQYAGLGLGGVGGNTITSGLSFTGLGAGFQDMEWGGAVFHLGF